MNYFARYYFNTLRKLDWIMVGAVGLISFLSLLSIYNFERGGAFFYFKRQLIFVAVGFFLMFLLGFFDYRTFKGHSSLVIVLYLLTLLILSAVLAVGRTIRGTTGWFSFGSINFAPVEIAKLVMILLLAKYFSLRHIELYRACHLVASFFYVGLPVFLVLLQPDLGSAFIILVIWLGMVTISGIRLRHLAAILLIAAICFGIVWAFALKDYQKERILTFLNPQKDPLGYSYNLRQAMIAVGSGQIWGRGLDDATQTRLHFLPEARTDFIFAAVAEEFGFAAVVFLFFSFALLIHRIIKIGMFAADNFAKLFSLGISLMFLCQIAINIGMNIGLMPIIGIPLPFMSYGGSATLINFAGLGILQGIKAKSSMF
jgi:rod shape determining protein RodA